MLIPMMDVDLMVPAAERIDLLSYVIGYTYIRNTEIHTSEVEKYRNTSKIHTS